jgi:hypothetical protein
MQNYYCLNVNATNKNAQPKLRINKVLSQNPNEYYLPRCLIDKPLTKFLNTWSPQGL